MATRDPETGQFVSGTPGEAEKADDLLVFSGGLTIDDGSNTSVGDTVTVETLTFQKDYEILGVEVYIEARGLNLTHDTSSTMTVDAAEMSVQVATTGSYAAPTAPDSGGRIPSGVYLHEQLSAQPHALYIDSTNGVGGLGGGDDAELHRFISNDDVVDADLTPDAGNTLSIHMRREALAAANSTVTFEAFVKVYVRERDD